MFGLKTIFRRLKKNRMVTFFSLAGFVLCFFALSLVIRYVYSELSVDRIHKNRDRIFAVSAFTNGIWVPNSLLEMMKDHPVFKTVIPYGFSGGGTYFKIGENQPIEVRTIFVDPSFFEAFSFKFISGNPEESFNVPYTAVITQSQAKRLFGDNDPVGQKIKCNSKFDLTITGVIADYPGNSLFKSQCFASFETLKVLDPYSFSCGWECYNLKAFVMLRSEADKEKAKEELRSIVVKNRTNREANVDLISLRDLYFDKRYNLSLEMNKGDMKSVCVFSFLGILIFAIALFNYFNLSVSTLIERRKETALLKIFGSNFMQQWFLLFLEAFILLLTALFAGSLLQKMFLNSGFTNFFIRTDSLSSGIASLLLPFSFTVLIALFASLAGTVYIKKRSFSDAYNKDNKGKERFQIIMLMAQFCIVTFLIGTTIMINRQVRFMQNTDPGFEKENLVCIKSNFKHKTPAAVIKKELMSIPGVLMASSSNAIPGVQTQNWGMNVNIDGESTPVTLAVVPTDPDFLEEYGFRLKKGRFYSDKFESDFGNIVINESAAKLLGWNDPIDKVLLEKESYGRKMGGVITGVVEDNHFQSMHKQIEPMIFINLPDYSDYFTLKIAGGFNLQKKVFDSIKQKWQTLEPDSPFDSFYFDQHLENEYINEMEFERLALLLSIISIVITALGLIGVSLFTARKKVKEIGIRKVNGATAGSIVGWLNMRYYAAMILSIAISLPLLWWFVNRWLQGFAYKVSFKWWVFVVAAIATTGITAACLTLHSWKAAGKNPVEALRYE